MVLTLGTRLGPYEIVAPLGAGGMGEVYRARDSRLDREVAIKILPTHLSASIEFRARFEREAKSISQLSHPNICTLHDVGQQDGTSYLVMELLDGQTLASRLEKGPLPLDDVLRFGQEVASALDAAHRKGVIHRDLKPGNIVLTKTGAKLLDFGLAKSAGIMESDPSAVTVSQPLTSKGTILGTFQYMAPEQLDGSEADARTDIFALGAVLYEMLTGKRAFEGANRASLIASIMASQPRAISERQPMTPPALDRLIRKCLAKDPDARWQSAADVADELRWIAEQSDVLAPIAASSSVARTRNFLLGLLSGAAVIAFLAFSFLRTPKVPVELTQLAVPLPLSDVLEGGLENLLLAISPDGRTIAYSARRGGSAELFIRGLDQREAVLLPGTQGAMAPFFSPDGQWVGFFAGGKLKKISVRGGVALTICDVADSRAGVWLDDDSIVFTPSFATSVMRVAASGGTPDAATTLDSSKKERTHRWPEALPGGEWVVFTVGLEDSPGSYDDCDIQAVSLKTGERKVLVKGGSMARYAPPGYLIFGRHNVLFAIGIDPRTATPHGRPTPVLENVAGDTTSGSVHFAVARNGTLVYVPQEATSVDSELVWVDRKGQVDPLPAPSRPYYEARVSPDGKEILTSIGFGLDRNDIWLFNMERQALARLTFEENATQVFWLPDGKRMLKVTEAPWQFTIQTADGSEPPQILHRYERPLTVSSVLSDGSALLASLYGDPEADIQLFPLQPGSNPETLIAEKGLQYGAVPSPDGQWVAYVSENPGGSKDVFIRRLHGEGPKWQVSGGEGLEPLWSPDGKELFYLDGLSLMAASVAMDGHGLTLGTPKKLFDFPTRRRHERSERLYDISPDGQRFLLARTHPESDKRRIHVVLNWTEDLKSKVSN